MLKIEAYTGGAMDQIMRTCETVCPEDAAIISDIISNTLTQFNKDMVDSLGNDIASGVKARVDQVLSLARSA